MHAEATATNERLLPGNANNTPVVGAADSQVARWQDWCRLCAKEDAQGNINVFLKDEQHTGMGGSTTPGGNSGDLSLAATIEKYFWVQITREEMLPKMLCTECFSLVTSLVNFTERVAKVQQLYITLQQCTAANQAYDLHSMRLKYGLLDEEREHVFLLQPLPEVHYFEAKPKINELEEHIFETEHETTTSTNPLAQPRIKIKIKKEHIIADDTQHTDLEDNEEDDEMEDPFHDQADDEEFQFEDEDFKPNASLHSDTNSSSSEAEPTEDGMHARQRKELQEELIKLNEEAHARKKQRRRAKRKLLIEEDAVKRELESETDGEHSESSPKSCKLAASFICTKCPREFKRVKNLRMHLKRAHAVPEPELMKKCEQCPRTFATEYQLKKHAKVHLPLALKKVIPCPHCDNKFSSNTLVQTHIKYIHMNERPFICEECGVAVHTNAALKTHMLTHTDYAPFECEVCKKGFKNQIRLKNHMETHDPNKHICAECGAQLNSRATLNRHLLVHSDEMQHKCDYCGRAFKRAKALKNHLILHTGLKPYSCDFCDRTFANGSNCRSHKKKAHPQELAALEAAGGGKTYTRNIPKLEALKAVTKAADNLAPVVSKQSGHFLFGKKPKPQPTDETSATKSPQKLAKNLTSPTAQTGLDFNALNSTLPAAARLGSNNVSAIPTIDNIYNHIMKQATMASQMQDPTLHIKRPPSQASSSCMTIDHEQNSTEMQMAQQHLALQQQPTPPPVPPVMPQHFYTHMLKQHQQNLAHDPAHAQHHHALLAQQQQQQQQQDEMHSLRSPDSQASHMTDDHSNTSAHFYNHMRQNLHGPSFM